MPSLIPFQMIFSNVVQKYQIRNFTFPSMWQNISRTRFVWDPVILGPVPRKSLDLVTRRIAFACSENSCGHIDIGVISARVLWHCSNSIGLVDEPDLFLERLWPLMQRSVVKWPLGQSYFFAACFFQFSILQCYWLYDTSVLFMTHVPDCCFILADRGCSHKMFFERYGVLYYFQFYKNCAARGLWYFPTISVVLHTLKTIFVDCLMVSNAFARVFWIYDIIGQSAVV